jgi:hypothetical protein
VYSYSPAVGVIVHQVLIPLFYVLAKNMEVDLQNKDLKLEIFTLCQKLGKYNRSAFSPT